MTQLCTSSRQRRRSFKMSAQISEYDTPSPLKFNAHIHLIKLKIEQSPAEAATKSCFGGATDDDENIAGSGAAAGLIINSSFNLS